MRIIAFILGVIWTSAAFAQVSQVSQVSQVAQAMPSPIPCPPLCTSTQTVRIDPTFHVLHTHVQMFGRHSPIFGRGLPPHIDTTGTGALLRFRSPPSSFARALLERTGVRVLTPSLDTPFLRVWLPFDAIASLKHVPDLLEVEATWRPIELYPLEVSTQQMGATAARRIPSLAATGKGIVMATIDSGLDPTHPHLFFADGGYFDWIDVNENGVFDPTVDAVDLDRDSKAGLAESLRILKATGTNPERALDNDTPIFRASLDWLYADQNRDGFRNFGRDEGFSESTPGYGEQIFVVDDLNQNDKLDPGEKLVRLKTSKILEFHDGTRVFKRGVDLIEASGSATFVNSLHGTGVASILVGGQAEFHVRVGVAPDAELIVYAAADREGLFEQDFANSRPATALETLVESPSLLILHEWTNPFLAPHDGSGVVEAMMDAASGRGMLQVNPVGNLNRSEKHIEQPLAPGESTDLEFSIGDGERDGYQPYKVAYVSLFWRNVHVPTLSIRSPSGQTVDVPFGGEVVEIDGNQIQATHEVTGRGTHHAKLYIFNDLVLSEGTWSIEVKDSQVIDVITGRITDYYSGWGRGIRWVSPTKDRGTIVYPATADSAIGVGAHASRWPEGFTGLRDFSGRGPRLDGERGVDITAPDDPYAAVALIPPLLEAGYESGWFFTFGGTSGAAPHVAGALALLAQTFGDLSADQLRAKLLETADQATNPDEDQGFGQLDVYKALTGEAIPVEIPLRISARWAEDGIEVLEEVDADVEFALDVDYDGTLDRPWQQQPYFEDVPDTTVKVLARRADGARAFALLVPTAKPDPIDSNSEPSNDTCETCSTSGQMPFLGLLALAALRRRRRI